MSPDTVNKIKEIPRKCLLLGDCAEATSLQKVTELIAIGRENMKLMWKLLIIITMLISKGAMKYMEMKLDFSKDIVIFHNGQTKRLTCKSSSHCLLLM